MKGLARWVGLLPASFMLVAVACSSSGGASSSSPTAPASPAATVSASPTAIVGTNVSVTLQQWSVNPSTTTIPAGPVTFAVTNQGTKKHEFVVLKTDTPAADIPIVSFEGEKDRINEDTAGTNVGETGDLAPGSSKTLTIDLQPGHYVFFCNLPGHYRKGMRIDVTVQ